MSNVRIEATGDVGIEVEVVLGVTSRGKHLVNAGESVDLTVGGNQRLVTKESDKAGSTAKADVAVGVDVSPEPIDGPMEGGPQPTAEKEPSIFDDWFGNSEIAAEAESDAAPVQGDLFDDGKSEG